MPTLRLCIAGCPPLTGTVHDFPSESEKERRDLWFRMFGYDPEQIKKGKKYYACFRHFSSRMCKGRTVHKLGFPDQNLSNFEDLNASTTVKSASQNNPCLHPSERPQKFHRVVLRLQNQEKPQPLKYGTIQYDMEVEQNATDDAEDDYEDEVVIDAGPAGANKIPNRNCILNCKDGHIFYKLPSIQREPVRRKKWLYLLGKDPNLYTSKDIYVCDQHFDKIVTEVEQLYPNRNLPPPLQDSIPDEMESLTECIQRCTDYRRKYRFPSVKIDAKRRDLWLTTLGLEPKYYNHDIYICDRHFSDQMRIDRYLIPNAIPDQNIFPIRRPELKSITKDTQAATATTTSTSATAATAAIKATAQQPQHNNQTKNSTYVKHGDIGTKSFTLRPILQIVPPPTSKTQSDLPPPVTYVKMQMLGVFVPSSSGYMESMEAAEDPLDFEKCRPLEWIAPIVPEMNIEVHQIQKEDYEYDTSDEGGESEGELGANDVENTDYYDYSNESNDYTDYEETSSEVQSIRPQQAEIVYADKVVNNTWKELDYAKKRGVDDIEENLNSVTKRTAKEISGSANNAIIKTDHDFSAYYIKMLKEAEVWAPRSCAQNNDLKRKSSAVKENSSSVAKRRVDGERDFVKLKSAQSIAATGISKDTHGIVRSQSRYFIPIKPKAAITTPIKEVHVKGEGIFPASDPALKRSSSIYLADKQTLARQKIDAGKTSKINTDISKSASKIEIQEVITITEAVNKGRDFVLEQLSAAYHADDLDVRITKVAESTDEAVVSAEKVELPVKKLTSPIEEITMGSDKAIKTAQKLSIAVDPLATPVDQLITPAITAAQKLGIAVDPLATPVDPLISPVEPLITTVDDLSTTVDPLTTPNDPLDTTVDPPATPAEPLSPHVDPFITHVNEHTTAAAPLITLNKVVTRSNTLTAANKPTTLADKLNTPVAKVIVPTGKNKIVSAKVIKPEHKLTTPADALTTLSKTPTRDDKLPTPAEKIITPTVKSTTPTNKPNTPVVKLITPTEKNSIASVKAITSEHKLTTPADALQIECKKQMDGALSNSKSFIPTPTKPIILNQVTKMNAQVYKNLFNSADFAAPAGRESWLRIVDKIQNEPKNSTIPAIKPTQNIETDDITEAVLNGTSWQEVRKIIEKKQKNTEVAKDVTKISNGAEKISPEIRKEVKYKLTKVVKVGGEGDKVVATPAIRTVSATSSNPTATITKAKRTRITKREVIDMRKDRGMPAALIKTGGKYLLVNRNLAAEKAKPGTMKEQQPEESSPGGKGQKQQNAETLPKDVEITDQNESIISIESTDSSEQETKQKEANCFVSDEEIDPQAESLPKNNGNVAQGESLISIKSTSDSERRKRQDQSESSHNHSSPKNNESLRSKYSTDEQFYGFPCDHLANKEGKDEQPGAILCDEHVPSLSTFKEDTGQLSDSLSCIKKCSNFSKLFPFPSAENGSLRRKLWFFELGLNFPMYWHKTLYICDKHFDRKMFVDEDTLNAMAYPKLNLSIATQDNEQSYEGLLTEWCDMRDLERRQDKEITRLKTLIKLKQEAARLMAELAAAGADQEEDDVT